MFITYKTTCVVTGKYYIGSHKTEDINDNYLGSGKQLKESIKLYGENSHIRDILGVFETRAESLKLEHETVNQAKQNNDPDILNLSPGGNSFDEVNTLGLNLYNITQENLETRLANLSKGRDTFKQRMQDIEYAERYKEKQSISKKLYYQNHINGFKGKQHSQKTRDIISQKAKINSVGEKNSQFGTFWLTDGYNNIKWSLSKGDFPSGFYKGRTIKK